MAATRFAVGERVKARTALFVPVGTPGTICEIRRAVTGLYSVQFDGHAQSLLVYARGLERVDRELTV